MIPENIKQAVFIEKRVPFKRAMETATYINNAEAEYKNGILEVTQYLTHGHRKIYYPIAVIDNWIVEIEVKKESEK